MKRFNNKGYMLVEIILAFALAFGMVYFITTLTIKMKNRSDDEYVKTLVATDKTIVNNKLMKLAKENGSEFDCAKLKIDEKTIKYDGEVLDTIGDYAKFGEKSCDNTGYVIKISVQVKLPQMGNENYSIDFNYRYGVINNNSFGQYLVNTMDTDIYLKNSGGMYRFQGTKDQVVNNYVCFGTKDKSACINNSNVYMYRVIGIDNDYNVKIIKNNSYKADGTLLVGNYSRNVNGGTYTSELTAMDIMEKLSNYYDSEIGVDYKNMLASLGMRYHTNSKNNFCTISNYDRNWLRLENECYGQQDGDGNYQIYYDPPIYLMYPSDYTYSYSDDNSCSESCKNSWLFMDLTSYDFEALVYGVVNLSNGNYYSYSIYKNGTISSGYSYHTVKRYVRPVFYLKGSVSYESGSGTITDPYMVSYDN